MFRKAFPIVIVLAMIFGLIGVAGVTPAFAGSPITFTFGVPTTQINAGASFDVPVTMNIPTDGTPSVGAGLSFTFDHSVVTLTGIDYGTLFAKHAALANCPTTGNPFMNDATIDNVAGTATGFAFAAVGVPNQTYCTGSGLLATLHFTAVANGKTNIHFTQVQLTYLDASLIAHYYTSASYTNPDFSITVGPAPRLAVTHIDFTPASGSPTTSALITVTNVGGGDFASTDSDVFTVAATGTGTTATPSTFTVTGPVASGATKTATVALDLKSNSSTDVTVTDAVFHTSFTSTYYQSKTFGQTWEIKASFGVFITSAPINSTINFSNLAIGNNQQFGSMTITSNAQAWTVSVSMDYWNLREWNGTGYVPVSGAHPYSLHDPLKIWAYRGTTATSGSPKTATGTLITDGNVSGQVGDSGEIFALTFEQFLHNNDAALTSPNMYHGVVTFTDAVSF